MALNNNDSVTIKITFTSGYFIDRGCSWINMYFLYFTCFSSWDFRSCVICSWGASLPLLLHLKNYFCRPGVLQTLYLASALGFNFLQNNCASRGQFTSRSRKGNKIHSWRSKRWKEKNRYKTCGLTWGFDTCNMYLEVSLEMPVDSKRTDGHIFSLPFVYIFLSLK